MHSYAPPHPTPISGGGVFPLDYMWGVSSNVATAGLAAAQALLVSSDGSVTILAEALPAGESYHFSLKVTNTMGGESTQVLRTIRKEAWPLVAVSIDGEASRELAAVEPHVLSGDVSLPELSCVEGLDGSSSLGLQLEWRVSPPVAVGSLLAFEGGRKLRLLAHALLPDVWYTIHLITSAAGSGVVGANTSVSVFARRSSLSLRIAGGDIRTIGRDAPLLLDASSESFDPDDPLGAPLAAAFNWSCSVSSAGGVEAGCSSALSAALITPRAAAGILSISPALLPLDANLIFSVTATIGSQSEDAAQAVHIVAGNPPNVQLASKLGGKRINPSDASLFIGSATSSVGTCAGVALGMSGATAEEDACTASFVWPIEPPEWISSDGATTSLETARQSMSGYPFLLLAPRSLPGGVALHLHATRH